MRWLVMTLLSMLFMNVSAEQKFETRGVIQATNKAELSAEISSRVTQMPFRNGEVFTKGALLVQFDCKIFQSQYKKVAAELKAARIKLENDRRLDKVRSIGRMEVALSEVSLEQKQAELQMAEFNRSRCKVLAPWNGRVVQIMVNENEAVELNQKLLSIVSIDKLEVELIAPALWLQWLKPGDPLTMLIDETGKTVPGTVSVIGSVVDPTSQTISVRVDIEKNKQLLPGMSGTATFTIP